MIRTTAHTSNNHHSRTYSYTVGKMPHFLLNFGQICRKGLILASLSKPTQDIVKHWNYAGPLFRLAPLHITAQLSQCEVGLSCSYLAWRWRAQLVTDLIRQHQCNGLSLSFSFSAETARREFRPFPRSKPVSIEYIFQESIETLGIGAVLVNLMLFSHCA